MRPIRPIRDIRHDLDTARAYRATYIDQQGEDRWVGAMRAENEREIVALEKELSLVRSSELELSLEGVPVQDHTVTIPYFQRVLEQLQAVFRSTRRSKLSAGEALSHKDSALLLSATAPGSFRAYINVPPTQLELGDLPPADAALVAIIELFAAAEDQRLGDVTGAWVSSADEPTVRGMIKLASTLASARGRTDIRLRTADGVERLVRLSADQARQLAISLAGETGREVISIVGHLKMAQDDPPRIRVTTPEDEYLAVVLNEDMLDRVKQLLFLQVTATLVIDMRTSPMTGAPITRTELLDLEQAPDPS